MPNILPSVSNTAPPSKWIQFRSRLRTLLRRQPKKNTSVAPAQIRALTGHPARDLAVYEQALRHRSLLRHDPSGHLDCNERLEFLGDAVLDLAVAEFLYEQFPTRDEGFLTRIRSRLVSGKALSQYAKAIGIGEMILMSDDMERAGGRNNSSLLANAYEAILGALYLDQGLEAARSFVLHTIEQHVDLLEVVKHRKNYKSMLLELAQARGWPQPRYQVVEETGPSHQREFTIEAKLNGTSYGRGHGRSKKTAEQHAARKALHQLRNMKDVSI